MHTSLRTSRPLAGIVLAAATLLAACGDGSSGSDGLRQIQGSSRNPRRSRPGRCSVPPTAA